MFIAMNISDENIAKQAMGRNDALTCIAGVTNEMDI
jgi:hypothetical protein